MTTKYNIRRSIDAGRPVAEDEPDQLMGARGIINGVALGLVLWFIAWVIWMICK